MAASAASRLIPSALFFTTGVGRHPEPLTSFELALRMAGIAASNLVAVSSIIPPGCRILSKRAGVGRLAPGQITFSVLARAETNEPDRRIAAAVGAAIPADPNVFGYLSEHHGVGETAAEAGAYTERLAAEMLSTARGRSKARLVRPGVRTLHAARGATGARSGTWTTVIAAVVLLVN